jgi:hypothetical protein
VQDNDGAIDMTVSGALGMLLPMHGEDGETSEDLSNLASGTYYVTVTDDITNCSKDTSFVLLPPTPPSVDAGLDITLNLRFTEYEFNGNINNTKCFIRMEQWYKRCEHVGFNR